MMRREQRKAENRANGVEDDTGELAETAARRFGDRRGGAGRRRRRRTREPRRAASSGAASREPSRKSGRAGGSKRGRSVRGAAAAAAASASGSANADDGGREVYCDDQNGAPEAPAAWRNLPVPGDAQENSRAGGVGGAEAQAEALAAGAGRCPPPGPTLEVYQDEDLVLAEGRLPRTPRRRGRRGKTPTRCADVWTRAARSSPAKRTPRPTRFASREGRRRRGPLARRDCTRPFVPSDTTDERGAEVSYEETRARRWARARAERRARACARAPVDRPDRARRDVHGDDRTRAHRGPRARASRLGRGRPREARRGAGVGRIGDAPPSDAGSGGRVAARARTDEARGSAGARRSRRGASAAAAVPAGLRWTATEGGTYGAEPTMTLCTKEAWGDIMSMFSDGARNAQPPEPAHAADRPPCARRPSARRGHRHARDPRGHAVRVRHARDSRGHAVWRAQDSKNTAVLPAAPAAPRLRGARALAARAPRRRARGFCGPELRGRARGVLGRRPGRAGHGSAGRRGGGGGGRRRLARQRASASARRRTDGAWQRGRTLGERPRRV